jgi:hypothetical protein
LANEKRSATSNARLKERLMKFRGLLIAWLSRRTAVLFLIVLTVQKQGRVEAADAHIQWLRQART